MSDDPLVDRSVLCENQRRLVPGGPFRPCGLSARYHVHADCSSPYDCGWALLPLCPECTARLRSVGLVCYDHPDYPLVVAQIATLRYADGLPAGRCRAGER